MTKRQHLALDRAMRVARWIERLFSTRRSLPVTETRPHQELLRSITHMQRYLNAQATARAFRGALSAALDREAKTARQALAKLDAMVRLAKMSDAQALAEWKQARRLVVPAWRGNRRAHSSRRAA